MKIMTIQVRISLSSIISCEVVYQHTASKVKNV